MRASRPTPRFWSGVLKPPDSPCAIASTRAERQFVLDRKFYCRGAVGGEIDIVFFFPFVAGIAVQLDDDGHALELGPGLDLLALGGAQLVAIVGEENVFLLVGR